MKTIREYMEQLDEISRRDFLKGAGAAALAGAAGGAGAYDIDYRRGHANALRLSDTEANALVNAVALYFLIQQGYAQPNPRLNQALGELAKINPAFKERMNLIYDNVKDSFNEVYRTDRKKFNNSVNSYIKNQESIINGLSTIQRPFDSMEEDLSEASPEAIAKISQLTRK